MNTDKEFEKRYSKFCLEVLGPYNAWSGPEKPLAVKVLEFVHQEVATALSKDRAGLIERISNLKHEIPEKITVETPTQIYAQGSADTALRILALLNNNKSKE